MKNYTITVNGNVYDVTVEEKGEGAVINRTSNRPTVKATKTAPTEKPRATGAGSVKIDAKAAGKVFKIEKNVSDSVKAGDTVLILEIMKMETPVVAPCDGTVASIDVKVGDQVEVGAILATLNE
ncbi:MAG: biotin/lipoyl-binding protein [Lachnobacterium sp.]|nr:biotin/lipoyl-binding protein [Lachnobacterium sp.]